MCLPDRSLWARSRQRFLNTFPALRGEGILALLEALPSTLDALDRGELRSAPLGLGVTILRLGNFARRASLGELLNFRRPGTSV